MDQIKLEFDNGGSNDLSSIAASLGLNSNSFPELLTSALQNVTNGSNSNGTNASISNHLTNDFNLPTHSRQKR